jgi:hypothetical protein
MMEVDKASEMDRHSILILLLLYKCSQESSTKNEVLGRAVNNSQ